MALSIDEFFEAVKHAPPSERWEVAATLNKRMCNDDRVLAAAWVADFILAMEIPALPLGGAEDSQQ